MKIIDIIDLTRKYLKIITRISFIRGFIASLKFNNTRHVVIKYSSLIPKYFLEHIDFAFSFKRRCSQLKITKDKKNILCIVPYMVVGGAERVILNIAKGVDREKFSFHLITTKPANNLWYNKFHSYFQNIIIPAKWVMSQNISNKYFRELIRKLNIDIILISNSPIGYNYLPQLKSEFKHIKIMDVLHVEDSPGATDELKWITPYLDRRICISNHLREYMIEKYKNSGIGNKYIERLKVIHNGIDVTEYSPNDWMKGKFKSRYEMPSNTRIISFIGRVVFGKNPALFIEVGKQVIAKLNEHNLRFVIGGYGEDFKKIEDLINKYEIKNYFILTGMFSDAEVIELLADTDILLITSKSEGIPLIALEAMAMKVPVISIDVGAIYELIKDNVSGYLISPGDNLAESFASKILNLLSENMDYRGLVEKTREMVALEYSLETMGRKYQDIFNELLDSQFNQKLPSSRSFASLRGRHN